MPKRRKRKLCTQAQGGSKGPKGAQATTAKERQSSCSHSDSLEVAGQEPFTMPCSSLESQGTIEVSVSAGQEPFTMPCSSLESQGTIEVSVSAGQEPVTMPCSSLERQGTIEMSVSAGQEPVNMPSSSLERQGTIKVSGNDKEKVTKRATCKKGEKPSSSQALVSTVKSYKDSLSKPTALLMEFLMTRFKKKKPILKEAMMKVVGTKYKHRFLEILKRVSFSMEVVFGIDIQEVESPTHSYSLVSKIDLPNNGRVTPGKGYPKTSLLMNLLGVIFMKGNCASEENIWEFLNKMKVYAGKKHFIYGEPKKLITQDLVKLKYLEYRQIANSDPPRYEFLWGPKSHANISKMQILEFLAKINNTVPSAFQSCYEEALREEEENTTRAATLSGHVSTSATPMNVPVVQTPKVLREVELTDVSLHI